MDCPITSCGIFTSGDCSNTFVAADEPSNLMVGSGNMLEWTQAYKPGYEYHFCAKCMNADDSSTIEIEVT